MRGEEGGPVAWRSTPRRWTSCAVLIGLAAGLTGLAPVAADGFGQGLAAPTALVEGSPGVDEVQSVAVDAIGGTFSLTFDGETTSPLAFNAAAVDVELALGALATVGTAGITVSGGPGGPGAVDPYVLTFGAGLGLSDVAEVTADGSGLTGDTPAVIVATSTAGQSPADEVQQLRVRASGGTYTFTFDGQSTPPLAFDLPAGALEAALEDLANLDPGDVEVSGGPGDRSGSTPYVVTFSGTRALTDVPLAATNADGLFAVEGGTLFTLPDGARPMAWSVETGQLVGTNVITGMSGWSWTPEGGYLELPLLPCEPVFGQNCHPGGTVTPLDVNDRGQVVGYVTWRVFRDRNAYSWPFLWSAAEGMRDLNDGAGIQRGLARHINDQGEVVGVATFGGYPDDVVPLSQEAFYWSDDGGMIGLGELPSTGSRHFSSAVDINDAGQVIGNSTVGQNLERAFIWTTEAGMVDLGNLGRDTGWEDGPGVLANDINDAGVVVGDATTPALRADGQGFERHAFRWTASDGMVDLGGGDSAAAQLVNEAGQVAGSRVTDGVDSLGNRLNHATMWSPAGEMTDLGHLGGGNSHPSVLGESGAVLGYSDPPEGGDNRAFFWDPEVGMVDLGNPSAPSDASATVPFALSEIGEILGFTNALPGSAESMPEGTAPEEPVEIVYWPNAGPGQPDQTIRQSPPASFAGSRVYNTTGARQSRSSSTRWGSTATFVVRTRNTGAEAARFTLRGRSNASGFQVRYLVGGRDVTSRVAAGTYRTPTIAPRGYQDMTVRVTVTQGTPIGRTTAVTVRATNSNDATRTDTAKAKVRVIR